MMMTMGNGGAARDHDDSHKGLPDRCRYHRAAILARNLYNAKLCRWSKCSLLVQVRVALVDAP
jgi:hypothetical protein